MTMAEAKKKVEDAAAGKKSLKQVLTIVIEEARRLSHAESCSVIMLDQGKDQLVFFSIGGERERSIEELRFPARKGITGHVVKTGKSELVNDPHHDPRFFSRIEVISGLQTRNIMVAPLRFQGEIIGADEKDLQQLDEFCSFAGEALGKSKKLADEIKSCQYLVKKFESTMTHLFKYKR
jgi:signal transduction protein with GAF and PtsI domain